MDTYGVAREQSVEKSQKNFIVPAVLLCALIMVGILLAPVQAFAATTKLDFRGTRDYAMAFQVLNLVNAERAKLSRPAVKMDATLLEAAMLRAAESRLFFSHTRPNGTSFSTVMPVASNRSENIAIGQTTAANVMAAWINSPGHYNNLMNANMTSIGVGCFELGNVRGWVQLFSTNAAANATQPANRVVVENIVVREDWLTIGVAPSTINLAVGATQALTTTVRVTGSGANPDTTWGAALPTESSGLQYTSNNTTVATVNASGTVTGVRGGTASVSIAPKGSTKSTSASVTVTAPVYTVTYNANGGSVSPASNAVNQGNSVTLPTPTRSGYTFNGWFTAATGGTKISSPYAPTASITLFAQWTQTITYNANGGTVTPSSNVVNAGSSVTLPTPTRSGYTFNGWFTAATGGTKISSPYTPTGNVTLFAQWTQNVTTYTVTYNANGGSVSPASSTVNAGSSVTLPTPTRNGYTFNGWFTTAAGGTKVSSPYTPTSAITLFAQWTQNVTTYTVTYNANGGSVSPASSTVNAGSSVTLPTPTRSGWTFNGWFTAATGGTKVSSPYTPTSAITLFAQWTQNVTTYTVTYNANGGSVSPASSAVNQGSSVTLPTPTRSGWTFNGWFTAATGGTRINSPYTPTANITLFAQWTQNVTTYTVTYNANGGSVSPASSAVNQGSSVTLPTPTRSGWTFNGWFTAATGGTKVSSPYTPTAAITLFAQWTRITYLVTYNANGGVVLPTSNVVNAGSSVTLPTPTRNGYTFNGWFTTAAGGTKVNNPYIPTSAITLFAQWTQNPAGTQMIIFDRNDGSEPTTELILSGEQIGTLLPTGLTRTGYTFKGWFDAKTGGTKITATYVVNDDVTLYAQWSAKKYTIKYYSFDGKKLLKSVSANYDSKLNAGSYAPKRVGKTFVGWFTAKTGGTKVTEVKKNQSVYARYVTATYTVKYFDHKGIALPVKTIKHNASPGAGPKRTGYTFIGWYTAKSGGTKVTKVTKSQSLYARYRVNQYTTKYYNHAGKLIKATKTNYNAKLMTGPKRTGYTFQGWFTAKTGGTKVTHVTKSRTVYARYKINQYTIKYYNHTGATLLETRTRNYNTGLMAGPKRMGYTFIGWYTAKSGGTKVTKVTKNQSLYARYRINQYTTKYYDGSKLIKTTKTNYNTKLMAGPKRTGYVFDGWYTAKTGGTKITNVTANRTVYARYIKYVAVTGFYSFPAHWSSVTIGVGSTETFGVGVAPANATNQRISVKSSNPNIASVTVSYEQGKGSMVNNVRIIGKQAGKATITLTTNDGGFKKTMTVTVVPAIPLQSIEFGFAGPEFSGGRFTIPAGLASYAVVGFTPAQATNKALTVVSSNPAIATAFIEEQGFGLNPILWVQAVSRGNATITVTSVDGGLRLTAPVTVVTGR